MEQEKKKKSKVKTIIPIILVIAIVVIIGVVIYNNNSKNTNDNQQQANEELTIEEQFAVDYLLAFAGTFKNPHSIKLYKVWVYVDEYYSNDKYYVAYNLSATNDFGAETENTYGNGSMYGIEYTNPETDIPIEGAVGMEAFGIGEYWGQNINRDTKEKGKLLDAQKIQKEFEKKL